MNKFNKGKLIGVVAASLSTVSLMGVGFASWQIQGSKPTDTGNLEVTVADTIDARVTLENAQITWPKSSAEKLVFDAVANDSTGPIVNNEKSSEQMKFTLSFDAKFVKEASFTKIEAYMTSSCSNLSTYVTTTADEAGKYLVAPISITDTTKTELITKDALKSSPKSGATDTYTYSKEFSFSWGAFFNKKNPSLITEDEAKQTVGGVTKLESYLTALNTLKTELNNAHFNIHLSVA